MPTQPFPRVVLPRAPASPSLPADQAKPQSMNGTLKSTAKIPRCELQLLLREASGETFEDGAPPSSVVLPLVTRRGRGKRDASD
jgi:hypothetical protein